MLFLEQIYDLCMKNNWTIEIKDKVVVCSDGEEAMLGFTASWTTDIETILQFFELRYASEEWKQKAKEYGLEFDVQ